jgi:hypothetical protein
VQIKLSAKKSKEAPVNGTKRVWESEFKGEAWFHASGSYGTVHLRVSDPLSATIAATLPEPVK